jgi:hypothetical protein
MSIYAGCGHNYYGNSCGKCATEAGAQQERAKIVEWLMQYGMLRNVAAKIEAKEHLK